MKRIIPIVIIGVMLFSILIPAPSVFGAFPNSAHAIAFYWTPAALNDTFAFWANATGTHGFCSVQPCLDTVSFTTSLSTMPTNATFQLKKIGTMSCMMQYGVWSSNIQNVKTGVAVSSSGPPIVPVQSPNNPIALSSLGSCASLSTSAYTSITLSFINGAGATTGILSPLTVYHVGVFVASNQTSFSVGVNGLFENFGTGAGLGAKYPGVEGTCNQGSCAVSGNADIPYFEIDGTGPVSTEPQTVLFKDDFLYNNPILESSWTIDSYQSPGANVGVSTSSGYLVMKALSPSSIETVHVTAPAFNLASYSVNGTLIKRKMTVSLLPFRQKETPQTGNVKAGMSPLLSSGAYPGNTPYGTPNVDSGGTCSGVNPIGSDYMGIDTAGSVFITTCGDGSNNSATLESGLDPTAYTVFTVETGGVFCNSCTDNVYPGTAWVYFRAYQDDQTGKVIQSTDKNINETSNIAPLFQTTYAFITQTNSNSAASHQISKIDVIVLQNFGSPVCLAVPTGFLCTRLPVNPGGPVSSLVGTIAWLSTLIGGGDEQAGALLLFVIMSATVAGLPFFFTRSIELGGLSEMAVLGFFVYAGFLPVWALILMFIGSSVLVVMLIQKLMGEHGSSMMGGSE